MVVCSDGSAVSKCYFLSYADACAQIRKKIRQQSWLFSKCRRGKVGSNGVEKLCNTLRPGDNQAH